MLSFRRILAHGNLHIVQLDPFISELLYTNDCVIIPGLGGFVSNTRNAFLNPAHHTFSPPSKRVAFNASLKMNDGLLASHLSREAGLTYAEALSAIEHFVDDAFLLLNAGEEVQIERVGLFSLDIEKNLQFEPDTSVNYLTDSFGLTPIHSPAIRREQQAKVRSLRNDKKKSSRTKISVWRLLEIVPAAAILTLLALNPNVISQVNTNLGNLNIFDTGPSIYVPLKKRPEPAKYQYFPQKEETPAVEKTSSAFNKDSAIASDLLADPAKEEVTASKEITPTAIPVPEKIAPTAVPPTPVAEINTPLTSRKSYYVIGGCFSIEENANKFLDQALADGFQASIIGKNDKGLTMVSLFTSTDVVAARTEMSQIKEKFQSGAWLLKK